MQSDIEICSVFYFSFVAFSAVRYTSPNSTMKLDLYLQPFPNGLQKLANQAFYLLGKEEDRPEGMV